MKEQTTAAEQTADQRQGSAQDAVQAPQTDDRPANGAEDVKADVSELDAEFEAMRSEYDAILSEKRERNEKLAAKLRALKEGPEKLIGDRADVAQYSVGQLAGHDAQTIRRMITAHLEKQLADQPSIWPPHAVERHKKQYVRQMVDYVLQCRQGPVKNVIGAVAHPATGSGTQVKSLAQLLGIKPFTDIEHFL